MTGILEIILKLWPNRWQSLMGEHYWIAHPEVAETRCSQLASQILLDGIKQDLATFGVDFKTWFSETSLHTTNRAYSTGIGRTSAEGACHTEGRSLVVSLISIRR